MGLKRRDFLRWGGVSLVGAGLQTRQLFCLGRAGQSEASFLSERLLADEYPFPYDDQTFHCAERIFNVRKSPGQASSFQANLNLLLKDGKRLDVKVYTSDRKENLALTRDVQSFSGVEGSLDCVLSASDIPRLHYQVQYREGQGPWKALSPRSFRLPSSSLQNGGRVQAIFIADDHNFDDGDYSVPKEYRQSKISGDYVNEILKKIRDNPNADPGYPINRLMNGFYLAKAIRYILNYEDPDAVIHLGDTTGIGSSYRWEAWGLPYENLTEADRDYIARTLWMRIRKVYSGLTPYMPVYIALGNHDGDEGWNPIRFRSKEWRRKYFPQPDQTTYPEGGHPDGNYYAFTLGGDSNNEGGVQFIVLDVTGFSGEMEPKTIYDWTLGQEQWDWLENVLKTSDRDWNFACYHHVLGGWPAGPGETDTHLAYGRGPLFTAADYQKYGDPSRVEQVKLTEMARYHGLRGFIYGHDHIFKVRKIVSSQNQREFVAVCGGSTKYNGEKGWWQGNLWTQNYGSGLTSNPDFWGPSGITRLTLKSAEARIDYIMTAYTGNSNLPWTASNGSTLSTTILANPAPSIQVDKSFFLFQIEERRSLAAPQTLKIKNGGGQLLNFVIKPKQDWIRVAPGSGYSWSAWKDLAITLKTKTLKAGTYEGSITIESPEASNNPLDVRIQLEVKAPALYPPLDFSGVRKEGLSSGAMAPILLTWKQNRLNKAVQKYRIYWSEDQGKSQVLTEVKASITSCTYKHALRNKSYSFAITSIDTMGRESSPALTSVGKSLLGWF